MRHPAKAYAWRVGSISCFQSEFQAPDRFLRKYGQHYHTSQDYWRIVFAGIIVVAGYLIKTVPEGFVPPEDQGYVVAATILPDGATLARTTRTAEAVRASIASDPAVAHEFVVNGFDLIGGGNKTSSATMCRVQRLV